MAYNIITKLPTLEELNTQMPIPVKTAQQIEENRTSIKEILSGEDKRKLMIIGPCSAWPGEAVIEYGERLQRLSEEVKDEIFPIMRCYIQKPRTRVDWTGPLTSPDPQSEKADLVEGMKYSRGLMLRLAGMGLSVADEILFNDNAEIFDPLLSWGAIGARSTEDQEHRIHASAKDYAVGMKNPTSGDISLGINSVVTAQHPHDFPYHGHHVRSDGNPYAHLVLRGGGGRGNLDPESLDTASRGLINAEVNHPAIIADLSHDNSIDPYLRRKDHGYQPTAMKKVLESMRQEEGLQNIIKGFMVESFILDGSQKRTRANLDMGGLSITDGCLGWAAAKRMMYDLAEEIARYRG